MAKNWEIYIREHGNRVRRKNGGEFVMNVRKVRQFVIVAVGVFLALELVGCAGAPKDPQLAAQCRQGLENAFQELEQAKANGFSGSVSWSKAATLLSTAKIQQQFDKYPNCIDKVKRARFYIKESQKA
jgi:hypothetical protein